MTGIDRDTAAGFARLTLGHVAREYPNKLDHVMAGPEDVARPRALHPIFFGSFDWHSCVHGWWQLMRLARMFPDMTEAQAIAALADTTFVPAKAAAELAYFQRPASVGFERPYGWGWLLALHGELELHGETRWAQTLEPLARAVAAAFRNYLPRLTYPIRVGTHFNSSFAMVHARDWGLQRDPALVAAIDEAARRWFSGDRDAQAWEPGGDEFLSSTLTQALLMSRVLPAADFATWFDAFLPQAAEGRPAALFEPAFVSDRSDGKIAHLDGLNLSRAWCWRALADVLGSDQPLFAVAREAAERHLAAGLPHLAGDYMGEHWLASFALLALEA